MKRPTRRGRGGAHHGTDARRRRADGDRHELTEAWPPLAEFFDAGSKPKLSDGEGSFVDLVSASLDSNEDRDV